MPIAVNDWDEVPASNTTIDGVNIAENCSPAATNNGLRAIMAGVKTFKLAYDAAVVSLTGYMPKAGGSFSGTQPIYTGEGAFLHNASSSGSSGRVWVLPEGSPDPSGAANGDLVIFYVP